MMPNVGSIVNYPYLWLREKEAGRDGARKDRTTCILLTVPRVGLDGVSELHLVLMAITDTPRSEDVWVEVSDSEKRKAGLDARRKAYVIVSEYNWDILPYSTDFDPRGEPIGEFTPEFVEMIRRALHTCRLSRKVVPVQRVTDDDLVFSKSPGR